MVVVDLSVSLVVLVTEVKGDGDAAATACVLVSEVTDEALCPRC